MLANLWIKHMNLQAIFVGCEIFPTGNDTTRMSSINLVSCDIRRDVFSVPMAIKNASVSRDNVITHNFSI